MLRPRVLVTGAGGFVGSQLSRRLASLGHEVTALVRSNSARLEPGTPGLKTVLCDLLDEDQVRAAVSAAQPQWVFHTAAHPDGREDFERMQSVLKHNLTGLGHLLKAVCALPAVTLVYADSAKTYGDATVPYHSGLAAKPLSSYAVSKAAGWQLIDLCRRVHGLRAVALRPTLIYGPGQGFNLFEYIFNTVRSGQPDLPLDGGAQSRDPLFIDDAVEAFIQAARRIDQVDGMALPIGGGREISVQALAELAVAMLRRPTKVLARPTSVRPTETLRSWCDNAEAKALLAWQPQTTLEQGILRTARAAGLEPALLAGLS